MKEFLLVYRAELKNMPTNSPEELQTNAKKWMDWIGSIAAQNKLVNRGNRLESSGKVVRADNIISDGPYAEIKESIGGYSIIKSESINDAVEIAKRCPVLGYGGNVEIREINV